MGDGHASNQDQSWEIVAPAWEQNRDRVFEGFRPASDWLIDHIDPQEGQTVLELAAGPGETGFLVTARIGATGRLISTDLSPSMVEAARRGAAERGLTNVECRVIDAQDIDLPDDSVDAVISRMGLMLVPDPQAAIGEIRRVLRPGGRLAYAVMGPPDRNPWMSLLMGALMQHGQTPVGGNPFALGGIFGLSSPDVNREVLGQAGFANVKAEEFPGAMHYDSVDDYFNLQCSLAGPIRMTIASMNPDDVAAVRATLAQMMSSFESDGGYDLPTLLTVVAAN